MQEQNKIASDFTFGGLLRFALPSMIMMICMSMYTIVDGIFVSRFVGTSALSAVNIVYPAVAITNAIGILFSTGGSAIIARKMGEGRMEEAKQNLSLIVLGAVAIATTLASLAIVFREPLIYFLGSNEALYGYCKDYMLILMVFAPVSVLQLLFQQYLVTAGRPHLGMILTIAAGVSNIVFDFVFIVLADMGVAGAALGTVTGYCIPALFGLQFFLRKKTQLHFARPKMDLSVLVHACGNGSSEMVSNVAASIITVLYNVVMMRMAGESGVAAITIVLYSEFLFTSLYLGYGLGVAPVISYNFGNQNTERLRKLFRYCLMFIGGLSVLIITSALLLSSTVVTIFTPAGTEVYEMAVRGMMLFSISYLFSGMNIFSSALFTALSNGVVSAVISFTRTFGMILPSILLLPRILGVDGVWLAVPIAELVCLFVSTSLLLMQNKRYHYLR